MIAFDEEANGRMSICHFKAMFLEEFDSGQIT